jgi:diguanylate cyclase (GGDEF)-like protein
LTFALIGIANFKVVIETYRYPIGDQVLETMSNFLRPSLQMSDFNGQYEGEEFIVGLPNVSPLNTILELHKARNIFY